MELHWICPLDVYAKCTHVTKLKIEIRERREIHRVRLVSRHDVLSIAFSIHFRLVGWTRWLGLRNTEYIEHTVTWRVYHCLQSKLCQEDGELIRFNLLGKVFVCQRRIARAHVDPSHSKHLLHQAEERKIMNVRMWDECRCTYHYAMLIGACICFQNYASRSPGVLSHSHTTAFPFILIRLSNCVLAQTNQSKRQSKEYIIVAYHIPCTVYSLYDGWPSHAA